MVAEDFCTALYLQYMPVLKPIIKGSCEEIGRVNIPGAGGSWQRHLASLSCCCHYCFKLTGIILANKSTGKKIVKKNTFTCVVCNVITS